MKTMGLEELAQRAVENAECAAQIEITDAELLASLVRNFLQELEQLAKTRPSKAVECVIGACPDQGLCDKLTNCDAWLLQQERA